MAASGLNTADSNAVEFASKLRHLEDVEARMSEFKNRYQEIQELYALINKHGLDVSDLDKAAFLNLDNEQQAVKTSIQSVRESKHDKTIYYQAELETGLQTSSRSLHHSVCSRIRESQCTWHGDSNNCRG